jgi:tRNA1Val (adenine37-N6)-methyltransferase
MHTLPAPKAGNPDVPGAWRLVIEQPPRGYRFALDAFLLADFVPAKAAGPFIDLGTGCGIVALCLARRWPLAHIVGVELQTSLAITARRNVHQNRLADQIDILQADIRHAQRCFPAGFFRTVVCNPPYRAVGHGRLNPDPEKAIARHELALTLPQLLQAARHLLRRHGVLVMVYHPSRLAELCARLETFRLRPRHMRLVHATPAEPASMVLISAVRDGRDALTVLPPLLVCDTRGTYSPEMQAIFHGRSLG